jgi:hypothetical protein
VVFSFGSLAPLVICPFCLGLAIDRATGWKVWRQMQAWENTRIAHRVLKEERARGRAAATPGDDSTP